MKIPMFPMLGLMLGLTAACSALPLGGKTTAVPDSGPQTGPDPTLSDQADLSDIVPDETGMRPADVVGAGPQRTIAGLGDPSLPGLWLETPLVSTERPGQVRLVPGGDPVQVRLLPGGGAVTAGSRLSLSAMRQLGAPLTDLVEIEVISGS